MHMKHNLHLRGGRGGGLWQEEGYFPAVSQEPGIQLISFLPVPAKSVGERTAWGTGIALDGLVNDCSKSLVESASPR